jgi:2-C-methyl-D-erythritol 2,4-cyclodiphosphate synthase
VPWHWAISVHHFPDTDAKYKGCSSRDLLKEVAALVHNQAYQLTNTDITIVAEAPKMASHLEAMRNNLVQDLGCRLDQINIKATTTEKLGFTGRGEGIACHAVSLLQKVEA